MMKTAKYYEDSHKLLLAKVEKAEYLKNDPLLWENKELIGKINMGKEKASKGKYYVPPIIQSSDEDEKQYERFLKRREREEYE